MVPVGVKRLSQLLKDCEINTKPATELMTTKAPPLNPQWSNQSVGSDEPIQCGQQWLSQQQHCLGEKGRSTDQKLVPTE